MTRYAVAALVIVLTCGLCAGAEDRPPLVVETEFSGGSAAVESIDQERRLIRLTPTAHKDRGWVCWWSLKVSGIRPGETLTLDVGTGPWATPDRAAFSLDGRTWRQTEPGRRVKDRIVYTVTVDAPAAWFAWGPPFVPEDAERLVKEAAERSPHATAFELCRTREGRSTPALRIAAPGLPDDERLGLWIQARQHAWESGSSWVCQGVLDWLLSDDEQAAALRRRAVITVVPIMDIDNVARGAGGKNQVPHDHNRDWTDSPHWRSVEAAQTAILEMNAEGRFHLFIDLHNPGANNREPYFYISPRGLLSDRGGRNLDAFLQAARAEMTGPLRFEGKTIESGANYDKRWKAISKNWVTTRCRDHVVAVCLETPWNTPHSTIEGYQQVGQGLGRAIARFLRPDTAAP